MLNFWAFFTHFWRKNDQKQDFANVPWLLHKNGYGKSFWGFLHTHWALQLPTFAAPMWNPMIMKTPPQNHTFPKKSDFLPKWDFSVGEWNWSRLNFFMNLINEKSHITFLSPIKWSRLQQKKSPVVGPCSRIMYRETTCFGIFSGSGAFSTEMDPFRGSKISFFEFRLSKSENIDHGAPLYQFLNHLGHSKVFFQIQKKSAI